MNDTHDEVLADITARIINRYIEKHAELTVEALPKLVRDVREALSFNGETTIPKKLGLKALVDDHLKKHGATLEKMTPDEADRLLEKEAARVAALRAEPQITEDADWDAEWAKATAEPEILPPTKTAQRHQRPAVPIGTEITSDYIVCLEEGKRCRSMKGHLRAKHNLTPEQYRKKWGLPESYPMVPPNYSAVRRHISNLSWKGRKAK